jgi:hypothetical protein
MKMRMLRTREPTLLSAIEGELWLVCAQIAFGRVLAVFRKKSAFRQRQWIVIVGNSVSCC